MITENILINFEGRDVYNSLDRSIKYNLAEVKYMQVEIEECERLLNYIVGDSKESYSHIEMLGYL